MSAPNYLLQYWEDQTVVFLTNLEFIRRKPSKKAVHDIRVAVKKLKSCLLLVSGERDQGNGLQFDSIQQFFRVTGKYRDIDMSLSQLRKLGKEEKIDIPSLRKYLAVMLGVTRRQVTSQGGQPYETELKMISDLMNREISTVPPEELIMRTEECAAVLLKEIKVLLEKFRQNAHPLRIRLKQLYYWLNQCPVNPFFDKRQMKLFDQILTALGNWHDYFVFREKIRRFRKEYLVKGTPEQLHARQLEEIVKLLEEQWLAEGHQGLGKLLVD